MFNRLSLVGLYLGLLVLAQTLEVTHATELGRTFLVHAILQSLDMSHRTELNHQ